MKLKEIILNSLRYPFSDWKRFLIVGILLLIGNMNTYLFEYVKWGTFSFIIAIGGLIVIEFIVNLLAVGYLFKIVKSSLDGGIHLPKFGSWFKLLKNGINVTIMGIFYTIPVILVILVFVLLFPSLSGTAIHIVLINTSNIAQTIVDMLIYLRMGIWSLISFLYIIIIYPIMGMAIVHMAYNDSKLGAAFKFQEIINKISSIGWKKFIMWYITIGIIYLTTIFIETLLLFYVNMTLSPYHNLELFKELLDLLIILIPTTFLFTYYSRALALIYKSE